MNSMYGQPSTPPKKKPGAPPAKGKSMMADGGGDMDAPADMDSPEPPAGDEPDTDDSAGDSKMIISMLTKIMDALGIPMDDGSGGDPMGGPSPSPMPGAGGPPPPMPGGMQQ